MTAFATHESGDIWRTPLVKVGDQWFDARLLSKFVKGTTDPEIEATPGSVARVRFQGGLGYVMPIKVKSAREIKDGKTVKASR